VTQPGYGATAWLSDMNPSMENTSRDARVKKETPKQIIVDIKGKAMLHILMASRMSE